MLRDLCVIGSNPISPPNYEGSSSGGRAKEYYVCLVYYLVLKGEGIMKFDAKGILKSIDFRFDAEGTQIDIIFLEETR